MSARAALLPLLSTVLVAGVLGGQVASGGGDFTPAEPRTGCQTQPPALPTRQSIDDITQVIVIDGVRRAACQVGTSTEVLLVALPSARERAAFAREHDLTEAQLLDALRTGLLNALDRLHRAGALPKVSEVVDEFASELGLPSFVVAAIRHLPASVIDEMLPANATLRRAITDVDLAAVLDQLGDSGSFDDVLVPAVRDAALAQAQEQLASKAGEVGSLFGFGAP